MKLFNKCVICYFHYQLLFCNWINTCILFYWQNFEYSLKCFINMLKCYVHYIFANLFCLSKREHLGNKEKCFLFHFESSFHSWDNQILNFQIFECHDINVLESRTQSGNEKESEEVCILIWTNFDSFTITVKLV